MEKNRKNRFFVFVFFTLFCLSFLLVTASAEAVVFYVDKDATGAGTGTSWTDAFVYLQDALAAFDAAHTSPEVPDDEIWVAAGTYYPDEGSGQINNNRSSTFSLPSWAKLYGGFDGTDGAGGGARETDRAQRDPEAYVTILSGDLTQNDNGFTNNSENAYHVIAIVDTPWTFLLDGFTITAGNANGADTSGCGGGIYCAPNYSSNDFDVYNCTVSLNNANYGGGVYIDYMDDIEFYNCVITDNTAAFAGGGVNNQGGGCLDGSYQTEMHNCIVRGNSAGTLGGGLYNDPCSLPILTNCIFCGNSAEQGGAIYNYAYTGTDASPVLTNCMFSGNSADDGGAMFNCADLGGTTVPSIMNCTFSGNHANASGNEMYNYEYKLMNVGNCMPQLTNCIVWNDSAIYNENENTGDNAAPTYAYCDIKGSGGSASWDTSLGTDLGGNIDVDPLFVDPPDPASAPTTDGDVHLQAGSPCIDAGTATGAPATDVDGNTRDALPDIGADEFVLDTDGDGEPDETDGCPYDASKIDPGVCGCAIPDADTDGDGVEDCNDGCPNDSDKVDPGICGCNVQDTDADGDGYYECEDCDDSDPSVYPGAPETRGDLVDNNCNGWWDELTGDSGGSNGIGCFIDAAGLFELCD